MHIWQPAVGFWNTFKPVTLRHHFFITGQGPSNQRAAITKKGAAVKSVNSRTGAIITNESSKANSQQENVNVHGATVVSSSADGNRLKTNAKVKYVYQVR